MGKGSTKRQTVRAMKRPSGVTSSKEAKNDNRRDVMNGLAFLKAPKVGGCYKFVGSHISIQKGCILLTSLYNSVWKTFMMLLQADSYKLVGDVATPSFKGKTFDFLHKKPVWGDVYGSFSPWIPRKLGFNCGKWKVTFLLKNSSFPC